MDIRTLKLYLHLCQTLHFGRTSEIMHVSPSTLSRTISRMEETVGAQLFERDNRRVVLTLAGEKVRAFAQQTVESYQNLKMELNAKPDDLTGQLRIFCSVTASYSLMLDLLNQFRINYPKVEVILQTGDAAQALQKVLDDDADIVVAPKPEVFPHQLHFLHLTNTPLKFVRPTMEGAVKEQTSGLEIDWQQIPLIVSEHGLARKYLDSWFKNLGIKSNIYAQVAGYEAIVSMVGLGLGVGVVPDIVIANSPMKDKIEIFDVTPQLPEFNVGLCSLLKRQQDPLIKAFRQCSSIDIS